MKRLWLRIFLSGIFPTSQEFADIKTSDSVKLEDSDNIVTQLTDNNFRSFVERHARVLIDFYAPWCGHCLRLEPEWEQAAKQLRMEGVETRLAKMDAQKERIGSSYVVDGYPTLRFFVNGKPGRHVPPEEHRLSARSIINLTRRAEFAMLKVLKEEEVDDFVGKIQQPGSYVLVARLKRGSVRAKAFMKAREDLLVWPAAAFRFTVVWLSDAADGKADARLRMWRPGFHDPDNAKLDFEGNWTGSNIARWAKKHIFGAICRHFSGDMWEPDILESYSIDALLCIMLDNANASLAIDLERQLLEIGRRHSSWRVMLLPRDVQDSDVVKYFNPAGFSGSFASAIVWSNGNKYSLDIPELQKPNSAVSFVEGIIAKKIKPIRRSAAVPLEPVDADGVTTLVARSFNEVVMDPKKAVIVSYTTPGCHECAELEPVWQTVGRRVQQLGWDRRGVVVAKLNIRQNEVEDASETVPYVVLYPAVSSDQKFAQRLVFTAERTVERIVAFLGDSTVNKEPEDDTHNQDNSIYKRKTRRIGRPRRHSADQGSEEL